MTGGDDSGGQVSSEKSVSPYFDLLDEGVKDMFLAAIEYEVNHIDNNAEISGTC